MFNQLSRYLLFVYDSWCQKVGKTFFNTVLIIISIPILYRIYFWVCEIFTYFFR